MDTKKRVLVVDDEPAILKFVRLSLKAQGYDVLTALNGEEALQLVKSKNPDIILLDVLMPGKNGFQVLEELRTFSQLPVIVFSARISVRDTALSLGANGFIAKPFTPGTVVERIEAILGPRNE